MRSTYVGTDPVYIRKTVNAGTSWTESPITGFTGSTYGLDFFAADTGYVVGSGGVILKTSNGGGSWVTEASGTTQDLRSLYFVNVTTGYVAGTNGTILK